MSEQTPASGPVVDGPADPEHDTTAAAARDGSPQTMSGALTRASSASWSVSSRWLCRSASTRRR